jgi:hypothetical protein
MATCEGSARVYCQVPELSEGFDIDNSSYEMQQNEEGGTEGVDLNGVKHAYRDETWSHNFFTYDLPPREFRGKRGASKFFAHLPTLFNYGNYFGLSTFCGKLLWKQIGMLPILLTRLGTQWGEEMGEFVYCRIESVLGDSHVHGNEAPTQYSNILGKRRLYIPLFNHFKHHDVFPVHPITKMPPYYKSCNL